MIVSMVGERVDHHCGDDLVRLVFAKCQEPRVSSLVLNVDTFIGFFLQKEKACYRHWLLVS